MLSFARNASHVYYKLFTGNVDVVDDFGNITGAVQATYSDMQETDLNIMPNRGNALIEAFGSVKSYDRVATTADTACHIDEGSILWVDGADVESAHNCIVVGRAPWKNSIAYALQMIEASNG